MLSSTITEACFWYVWSHRQGLAVKCRLFLVGEFREWILPRVIWISSKPSRFEQQGEDRTRIAIGRRPIRRVLYLELDPATCYKQQYYIKQVLYITKHSNRTFIYESFPLPLLNSWRMRLLWWQLQSATLLPVIRRNAPEKRIRMTSVSSIGGPMKDE